MLVLAAPQGLRDRRERGGEVQLLVVSGDDEGQAHGDIVAGGIPGGHELQNGAGAGAIELKGLRPHALQAKRGGRSALHPQPAEPSGLASTTV